MLGRRDRDALYYDPGDALQTCSPTPCGRDTTLGRPVLGSSRAIVVRCRGRHRRLLPPSLPPRNLGPSPPPERSRPRRPWFRLVPGIRRVAIDAEPWPTPAASVVAFVVSRGNRCVSDRRGGSRRTSSSEAPVSRVHDDRRFALACSTPRIGCGNVVCGCSRRSAISRGLGTASIRSTSHYADTGLSASTPAAIRRVHGRAHLFREQLMLVASSGLSAEELERRQGSDSRRSCPRS